MDEIYDIPDLIFLSLKFDEIVKPKLFKSHQLYFVACKGMFTSVMPILNGEKQSGVTLHKIDAGIDTGEIIDQIAFENSNIYKSEIIPITSDKTKTGKVQKIREHLLQIDAIDYVVHAFIDFENELFECAQRGDIARIRQMLIIKGRRY